MSTNWVILVIAGLLEVCWAVGLKYTESFTRPLISVVVIATIILSTVLLGVAIRTLPVGTAYAVWVGIGVVGTVLFGIFVLKEPATLSRLLFLTMLVASIVGLKLTSAH